MRYALLLALALAGCSHGSLVHPGESGWLNTEVGLWPFVAHELVYCVATDAQKAPAPVCYRPIYVDSREWIPALQKTPPSAPTPR